MEQIGLAEAIRLGATMSAQTQGDFFRFSADGAITHTCAIGAALQAVGCQNELNAYAYFPVLKLELVICPECGELSTLDDTIQTLNDDYDWTRNRIADWVDEILPPVKECTVTVNAETVTA